MKEIYDKLIEIKKVSEANTPEDAKKIIDKELESVENFTYLKYDNLRQALNKRINLKSNKLHLILKDNKKI